MTARDVLNIISSLHGGFNGDVPGKQIGVERTSDTEAIYSLTLWGPNGPTDMVERYRLTLEPIESPPGQPDTDTDTEAAPDEGAASSVPEGGTP
jgi:hypothetical protein